MQTILDFQLAKAATEAGIKKAVDHAEATNRGWNNKAFGYLLQYVRTHSEKFLMEEFRQWAEAQGLPSPPHLRAYGGIALRAAKCGFIRKIGTQKVSNVKAHCANASVWVPNI
ncbi:MAG: hypothetical protein LCH51_07840 [Bacteroidetes bacterium]|nr:hypothetical protein [Bacteroidota bacterium]